MVVPGSQGASRLPRQPRQVERGGRRAPFSTGQVEQDQAVIRGRQGGFANPGEFIEAPWTPPNQNVQPKAMTEFQGYRGAPGMVTTPAYNPFREHEEADLFSQSDNTRFGGDNGDFIPLTYTPTKTSWPANGWDHRRTVAAGYSKARGLLRVQFYTDGATYDYGILHPVMPETAHAFRLAQSPGRFINEVLENYGFARVN